MEYNGDCEIKDCRRQAITAVQQNDPAKMPMWLCRPHAKTMRVVQHALGLLGPDRVQETPQP